MRWRWPWVSRFAYDQVAAERDRLELKNGQLIEHLTRVERHERGMAEVPRRQRPAMEPMPKSVQDRINKWASRSIRKQMGDDAYRAHARGKSWAEIEATMIEEEKADG